MNRPKPTPAPEPRAPGVFARAVLVLARGAIQFYRMGLSPLLAPRCRHLPTCSEYALEALHLHGPWRGLYLSGRRLLRCQPWGTSGYDPVPPRAARRQHDA